MERQTQETAFASRLIAYDLARNIQEHGTVRARKIGDDTHDAALFDNKKTVGLTGRADNRHRIGKPNASEGFDGGVAVYRRQRRHLQGRVRDSPNRLS